MSNRATFSQINYESFNAFRFITTDEFLIDDGDDGESDDDGNENDNDIDDDDGDDNNNDDN